MYDIKFNVVKSQFFIFKGLDCAVNNCSIIVNNETLQNIDKTSTLVIVSVL
jgi:hypothetical protein